MRSTWSYIARIYVCADILCSLCEDCEVVKVSCVESLAVGVSHVMRHKFAATLSLPLSCYRARCRALYFFLHRVRGPGHAHACVPALIPF